MSPAVLTNNQSEFGFRKTSCRKELWPSDFINSEHLISTGGTNLYRCGPCFDALYTLLMKDGAVT